MIDHLELTTENYDAMCSFYLAALQPLGYTRIAGGPPAGFGTPYAPPFWLRPGVTPRPNVHPSYYAAMVRDPDGNPIEFACHDPL